MTPFCHYYQAVATRETTWFLIGILRSYEHLVFERTVDKTKGIIEFFVPQDLEDHFLTLMQQLQERNVINQLQKLPNRLEIDSK
jgi:hypothetical protein